MKTSLPLRAAVLLVTGLALAGCSGGNGDDGAAAPSAAPLSTASSPAVESPSATSEPTTGSGASQEEVAAQFCADRDELNGLGDQIEQGGVAGAIEQMPEYVRRIDAMEPPEALAADFQEYRAAWHSIADALSGASADDPALQGKVQAAIAAHPDEQAVEERLRSWAEANCPGASSSPTAS